MSEISHSALATATMSIKKIIIFGASGQIGLKACTEALNRGFIVRAFSRDPSQYPEEIKQKVEIVQGDVTNKDDVEAAVSGQDAVIVTLGTRNNLAPTKVLSQGMQNIIEAMKLHGVNIVSVCISAFLFFEPEKVPTVFHAVTTDHKRMFESLKESGINWIAVFPPHFTDAASSKYAIKHDGLPGGRSISKVALGCFMIDALSQTEHYQRVCGISQAEVCEEPKS